MKLTFEKADIVKAVGIVQKAVSVRTTMNILECILIDATTDSILLTGNDLDLAIQTKVEGQILEPGAVAVNARFFSELMKKYPDSTITLEVSEDNNCFVTCEKRDCSFMGMPADEFTEIPDVKKEKSIVLSQLSLRDMINQTIFSLAMNDFNPMMTGELFEIKEGKMRVIGLDSHRISIRNLTIDDAETDVYVVIPGKSLKEVAGILSQDAEQEVTVSFASKHVLFELEDTKIVSRLLEGKYFNVNQMFSNDSQTNIIINRKALIDAIETDMVFIKENDRRPVILDIRDNLMEIKVSTGQGKGKEEIEIQKEGEDLKIGFNPKFLIDALKVIEDEEIKIAFVNAKSPCFIRDDDMNYMYLILPVNFSE